MPVIRAVEKQLLDILFLLRRCTEDMNDRGMFHWNRAYPSAEIIREDIRSGTLFIYHENSVCTGMVVLNTLQSEEYREIEWRDTGGKVLIVHRLAVHPAFRGRGTGRELMEFAVRHMRAGGYSSLRLDVIESNPQARQLYRKMGFRESGSFHFPFQKSPFIACELVHR